MLTIATERANARVIIQGCEMRSLRGGDGTRPATNQDLLDMGIAAPAVPKNQFPAFIPGILIVR